MKYGSHFRNIIMNMLKHQNKPLQDMTESFLGYKMRLKALSIVSQYTYAIIPRCYQKTKSWNRERRLNSEGTSGARPPTKVEVPLIADVMFVCANSDLWRVDF